MPLEWREGLHHNTDHGAPWAAYVHVDVGLRWMLALSLLIRWASTAWLWGTASLSRKSLSHGPSSSQDILRIHESLGARITDCFVSTTCKKEEPSCGHWLMVADCFICVHFVIDSSLLHLAEAKTLEKEVDGNRLPG